MVFELAAICAAKFVAIAVVLAPTLNWFAVNEDTAATKLAPPTVTVTGFTPPLKAAVETAVGELLVTEKTLQKTPAFKHDTVTTVDDALTVDVILEFVEFALIATDKFTAVFVELNPCATFPPTMKLFAPGGPKIEI